MVRHRLIHKNGVWFSLPKLKSMILCSWQSYPVYGILFTSPTTLIMDFFWFSTFFTRFFFVCITSTWIKTREENGLTSFFAFLPSCHESSLCDRMLVEPMWKINSFQLYGVNIWFVNSDPMTIPPVCTWIARIQTNSFLEFKQYSNLVLLLPKWMCSIQSLYVHLRPILSSKFLCSTGYIVSQRTAPSWSRSFDHDVPPSLSPSFRCWMIESFYHMREMHESWSNSCLALELLSLYKLSCQFPVYRIYFWEMYHSFWVMYALVACVLAGPLSHSSRSGSCFPRTSFPELVAQKPLQHVRDHFFVSTTKNWV